MIYITKPLIFKSIESLIFKKTNQLQHAKLRVFFIYTNLSFMFMNF